ncbi:similar to Saccharomyces cerevisiae YPL176C TRE1 Plasma membrane protein that binds to Bsd2p and regulates ubiquitylation and vacuolar degradation of the metal transporter Smf1p [Maudiozyma saulgeensis]|uniref:Similar to Saccharomyces cerevisiae YPL176C TRE1 Plasma membrane protein that binds to Bsd2p and regulates ubiquitylation and vacuolar degradation of the metal transporter Smf1p n=1 Tax=Maudiozyma saulgeensis TaxID=1789683 RepID=A0A1X7R8V4_9SACH|nr:similar to Saccharomyces cerevisiae YPL176C TRE1 Plasma membrane protein that binds to Bsd2p and regulates ubiquitylation and vacuolar degradation of the metal transporter Smf1p [Kazachstania saulgeensis]
MRLGRNKGYNQVDADDTNDLGNPISNEEEDSNLISSSTAEDVFNNELDNAGVEDDLNFSDNELPIEPPSYDVEANENGTYSTPAGMEQMEMDDPLFSDDEQASVPITEKIGSFFVCVNDRVVIPVRRNVVDPLAQGLNVLSVQLDFYLNKVGNPLILRRFFYIILMSIIAWIIMSSGFLPNKRATHSRGLFADYDILIDYARKSFDLSKLERDLEYISSMPHMSGTKGDSAVRHYLEESFNNNGLKIVKELEYRVYATYPGNSILSFTNPKSNDGKKGIELHEDNFNPMAYNASLNNMDIIYGFKGREIDLQQLKENNMLENEFVLLLKYDTLPSEQMLLAQKYKAKGVIFITDKFDGDDGNAVQVRSVCIPQIVPGDPVTPGWFGNTIEPISPKESKGLPQIPSIPLSYNQGKQLLDALSMEGVSFEDDMFSGIRNDVKVDMTVDNAVRESHSITDIIGKIEGKEQTDKAIIIAATRSGVYNGAKYPSFGSAILLSLLQLFQEMKYKYDWKPLRNIYFISYGGSEFNYAGATELIEERLSMLKDEVYTLLDVSELGIWDQDRKINIESHPVLHKFFASNENNMGFEVNVEHVHHYGDWLPFLANGIPVSIFSSPKVRDREFPIDTKFDTFDKISESLKGTDNGVLATDLLIYLFKMSLELVDTPLLPFHVDDYITILDKAFRDFDTKTGNKLNFNSVTKGLLLWKRIGIEWSNWRKAWEQLVLDHEEGIEPSLISVHRWTWNKKLSNIGRRQCIASGLPGRPFYKNVLFSPPLWSKGETGSDSWLFPGLEDALNLNDWNGAQSHLDDIGKIIEYSATVFIEETNDVGF